MHSSVLVLVCVCVCWGCWWVPPFFFFSFFHAISKRDLLCCHGNHAHTEPQRASVHGLIWPDHDVSLKLKLLAAHSVEIRAHHCFSCRNKTTAQMFFFLKATFNWNIFTQLSILSHLYFLNSFKYRFRSLFQALNSKSWGRWRVAISTNCVSFSPSRGKVRRRALYSLCRWVGVTACTNRAVCSHTASWPRSLM